jgi:hypothetical protein
MMIQKFDRAIDREKDRIKDRINIQVSMCSTPFGLENPIGWRGVAGA